jgi:hypothetical protein
LSLKVVLSISYISDAIFPKCEGKLNTSMLFL